MFTADENQTRLLCRELIYLRPPPQLLCALFWSFSGLSISVGLLRVCVCVCVWMQLVKMHEKHFLFTEETPNRLKSPKDVDSKAKTGVTVFGPKGQATRNRTTTGSAFHHSGQQAFFLAVQVRPPGERPFQNSGEPQPAQDPSRQGVLC